MDEIFRTAAGELPDTIPIIPLSGVLLLPRGRLPLNVFEPRYIELVADALAGDRIVGMVQPLVADAEEREAAPEIYATGCAGRITAFEEIDDGRFEIVLTGLSRFDIEEEPASRRSYRFVTVRWHRFQGDLRKSAACDIGRARLAEGLRCFLEPRRLDADWDAVDGLEDEEFVTWLAMLYPLRSSEKQALLESPDLTERARLLRALMDMAVHEGDRDQMPYQ